MDQDNNTLMQEMISLQTEQNKLLQRYLWRLRFSLLTLLLITTATAVMLGMYGMKIRSVPRTPPVAYPSNSLGAYGPGPGPGNVPPYSSSPMQPNNYKGGNVR